MCYGATCSECSKKAWRGCGNHIPQAMAGVKEEEWCTCEPKVKVGDKEYPPAAKVSIPGISWLSNLIGGGGANKKQNEVKKDEGKEEL